MIWTDSKKSFFENFKTINNLITKAMKRLFFAAILLVAISCAAISRDVVAKGKTHTDLGKYKIEKTSPVTINGTEVPTLLISYQNSPLEVKVAVMKDGDCKKYFVLSDKLSVQYVCNENYFGVERLDKSFELEGYNTSDAALNRSEYFHQKVLCSGQTNVLDNTRLIAAYFPMLLNSNADVVAAK